MKKISATILDFAKPLTDGLAADAPFDLRRDTLRIAITLWNALVFQASSRCSQSATCSSPRAIPGSSRHDRAGDAGA